MDMERSWSGLVSFEILTEYTTITNKSVVIVLIAAEILVAAINIVVDLYAGE